MPALTKTAFSTLDPAFRPEGTILFNIARLYGSTIGIALVQLFLYNNSQAMHVALAGNITPATVGMAASLTGQGRAMLNDIITG